MGSEKLHTEKGVYTRLILGLSESSKFQTIVKDEATVDVLGMCLYTSSSRILYGVSTLSEIRRYITYRRGLSALLVLLWWAMLEPGQAG